MQANAHNLEAVELKAFNNAAATLISHERDTMYPVSYGELYDKDMSAKECAAEIRKTLRRLARSRHSPLTGAKVSVRYRTFAGGCAVDVRLMLAGPVHVSEDDEAWNRQDGKRWPWLTDEARAAKQVATELHDGYNFDGSDTQTDYFHVKYYGSVEVREVA